MAYIPKEGEKPKYHCSCCGEAVYVNGYMGHFGRDMHKLNWCFSCVHWRDLSQSMASNNLVIEGTHYQGKPGILTTAYNRTLGMGGRTFTIRTIATGDVWQTNNLWTQGQIPDAWLHCFPNTHEFVKAKKVTKADGSYYWRSR